MTTPSAMSSIIESLKERIADAAIDAAESHKAAMNSYGAGYDCGYLDALKQTYQDITGDEWVSA